MTTAVPSRSAAGGPQDDVERFDQRNDIFCRSFWDEDIRSERTERFYRTYRKPLRHFRSVDGFGQRDYAVRNASWHLADVFAERRESEDRREGFLNPYTALRDGADQSAADTPEAMTDAVKRVARACGADLVGVTGTDARWLYARQFSAATLESRDNELPPGLGNVVMVATAMDRELIQTVPSALSGAATGFGYARDIGIVLSMAQFIRNLGYRAVPSLNDTALAIPLAMAAGLGEYGRHGLLITKEFGPRVRLGKVFTDLPLVHDRPIRFGVERLCRICRRCVDACPPHAISGDAPTDRPRNRSTIRGVTKWSVDAERCFGFWVNQNSDCSICVRVCPYNKDFSRWVHRVGRWLAGTPLRRVMLLMDRWLGYGTRKPAGWWWGRGNAGRTTKS